jgi:SnoaL-like domain
MEVSNELRNWLEQIFLSVGKADSTGLDEIYSADPNVLYIGSDSAEWITDINQIIALAEAQTAEVGEFSVTPGEILAVKEGSVGWVAAQPLFKLGTTMEVKMRFTGVLHQENDAWKFVQMHYSIGVANQAVVGKTLTTHTKSA